MSATDDIRVLQEHPVPRGIPRRQLAQAFLSIAATAVISPFSTDAHPVRKLLLNGILLDAADDLADVNNAAPLFLSAEQLAALDVLSEAIVPGARAAKAAPFIDLLLNVESGHVQKAFVASLDAIEGSSQSAFYVSIAKLSADQLHELLSKLSAPDFADHQHFNNLKDWIAGAYFSSEIGMRELGWTPDRVFSSFPGCSHADGHS
jgi:Gluconate 2-dehydrogenase subunit 3